MISITEIQMRFESAILSLSQMTTLQPKKIPELVVAFMNILIMASESGIDLESKTIEVLMELEQPSFFGA